MLLAPSLGLCLAVLAAEAPRLPPGVDLSVPAGDPVAARLAEAFRLLEGTPTGNALLQAARRQKVAWSLEASEEWMYYLQNENAVRVGRAFVERYPAEQLAYMFAHELEHARQVAVMGGPPGYNADELEFGGLSAQARVWAELGAPAEDAAWQSSRAWLKDNAVWLAYPEAAYFSWRLRRYPRNAGLSDPGQAEGEGPARVREYWTRLAAEDAAWRRANAGKLPPVPPSVLREAFHGMMEPSLRAALDGEPMAGGEFSAWLPAFLQAVPALAAGADFPLPAAPTGKDLQLLSFLEHEVAAAKLKDGRWLLRKGSERTVPLEDLKGNLELLEGPEQELHLLPAAPQILHGMAQHRGVQRVGDLDEVREARADLGGNPVRRILAHQREANALQPCQRRNKAQGG
ncbi:MAG: hypothetical protein HYV15_06070, partial [Elusimicrobia bacterium]|nr:hypothetical protein [Elusimicrobiota bacterium]